MILLLVSLLFIVVINPYSLFKFKIFVLNTSIYIYIYMQLLSNISILSTLYSMHILIVSVLTDKLYSNHAMALAIRNNQQGPY